MFPSPCGHRSRERRELITPPLDRLRPLAPIVLRLTLGVIFFRHGILKCDTGIGDVESAYDGWGVPLPGISASPTAVVEIVAGVAPTLGLGTRLAAGLPSVVMIGSLLFFELESGLIGGAELDLALLAGLVTIVALGPEAASADRQIGVEDRRPIAV